MHSVVRILLSCLLCLLCLTLGASSLLAADPPFPIGESEQTLHGLKCTLVLPKDFDAAKPRSMVVVLHGLGGTATGMARALTFLAEKDFAVVAPKSVGNGWEKSDLDKVKLIVADLKTKLNVGEGRLHGVGFSNGGWNLHTIAFDPELKFTSGAWVAAGCRSGAPDRKQAKTFDAIALAGTEDGNRSSAEATVPYLRDKVRSVEVHLQEGLGHKWPRELMPYYGWWITAIEGRFELGSTRAFPWKDAAALTKIRAEGTGYKGGAFAYVYAPGDAENPLTKQLENEFLRDPTVQFFGRQIQAFKLNREEAGELLAGVKLKTTPAIVTFDKKGKPKKVVEVPKKAKLISAALKSVAVRKKAPKK